MAGQEISLTFHSWSRSIHICSGKIAKGIQKPFSGSYGQPGLRLGNGNATHRQPQKGELLQLWGQFCPSQRDGAEAPSGYPHGLSVRSKEEAKPLLDNEQSDNCFEGQICNVFYITLLAGQQHGASVSSYRLLMENTLVMAKAPFSLPKASPRTAQGWIAGLSAQGILPVITGNRFRHTSNYVPKFVIITERFMLQMRELMGHKTCLPVFLFVPQCFLFFSFSLLESWGLGFVAGLGFFPTRGADSSWLDCSRQEGGGMPVGSSDLMCLVQLICFNLWAVGRWWLQHIKASLGNNT